MSTARGPLVARAKVSQVLPGIHLLPFLTGGIALALYTLTLMPDITWAYHSSDGGELISAACTLGVPHPPGYPTYILIGRLVCALPLEPVARTFHLFSALAVAVAAGLVTVSARYLVPPSAFSRRGAVATGLFFALLLPVWQQALVAEVYALNLALLSAFLWVLLSRRPAWLGGLLLGLSLTTHLTSIFMLPLALLLLPRGRWPTLAGGICLGLLPFLTLPLLAGSGSPVIWGEPTTLQGWWWLVSARLYQPNLFALPLSRWPVRLAQWAALLLPQLAVAALLLPRRTRNQPSAQPRGATFLPSLLLYVAYAFTYNTEDSLLFLLPALLLFSILLARPFQLRPAVALFLPLVLLLLNFSRLEPGEITPARSLAQSALQQAPPGAILLTAGDRSTFTLWYLQTVEGERADLLVVDRHLLGFSWYREQLQRQYPSLGGLSDYNLEQFQQVNERPLCVVNLEEDTGPFSPEESCK